VPSVLFALPLAVPVTLAATSAPAAAQSGVGNIPQGTQSAASYANSFAASKVTNTYATTSQVSCYRPEVPYFVSDGPNDGYIGMSPCPGATTGEDTGAAGPYPTQVGSNPGYPAAGPMLVKDHSESDIRVDPANPRHLIGSSKWIVSAEGYNHVLGFYESFNGGKTWSAGHIPGYEGWTDNTDPVGAFDGFGNYYEFILPYQFFYNSDGSHNFTVGMPLEPNPVQPAEAVAMAVRPHGATSATDWITTHARHPDFVATYDSVGNEPDKQWMTIDDNPASPHYNRVYAMWVDFHTLTPVPYVSYDGGATWTSPIQANDNASPVDEFQPNLTVAAGGTVSVNFYDRRLACPAAGTAEATAAGLALDQVNPMRHRPRRRTAAPRDACRPTDPNRSCLAPGKRPPRQ
jgi:hypothetical protein